MTVSSVGWVVKTAWELHYWKEVLWVGVLGAMARSYTPYKLVTEVQCVVAWLRVTNGFAMLMAI